jgi:hypothetical protein
LAALAGLHLDIVNRRAKRNISHRQAIAHSNFGIGAVHKLIAHLKPLRSQDITLFAIGISQQCDIRRPIRVIFDGFNRCGDVVFKTLKINDSIFLFMAAAPMANGNRPAVIPARVLF